MPKQSVFGEEWRACLREHYMVVIRNKDTRTEKSLLSVMEETGFTERELAELRVQATMHVDDVGPDFEPDLDILAPSAEAPTVFLAVQAAELPGEAVLMEDRAQDQDEDTIEAAPEELAEAPPDSAELTPEGEDAEPSAHDDDQPEQLSLF